MDRPMNILLVEDNPGDAFLVKFYLEESMFSKAQFIHAEFLGTAIDLISKNNIDVILLDLGLPDSQGIDTLKKVLEVSTNSVVIVLTGLDDEDLGVKTVKLGAQDFLIKGQFDGKVLTSSVRYAFERYQLQNQVAKYTDKLDESKMQLTCIQELVQSGYWQLDLNEKHLYLDSYARKLLDIDSDEVIDLKALLKLIDPTDTAHIEAAYRSAIESTADIDAAFKLANGKSIVCRSKGIMNGDGKLSKLCGVFIEQ